MPKSADHPNMDAMLRDPKNNKLPAWHPKLRHFQSRRKACKRAGLEYINGAFKCVAQPTCKPGVQFLKAFSATKKGSCATCSNVDCGAGFFRTGACSGATNGFKCNACANNVCTPVTDIFGGEATPMFRTGTCDASNEGFTCQKCSNVK